MRAALLSAVLVIGFGLVACGSAQKNAPPAKTPDTEAETAEPPPAMPESESAEDNSSQPDNSSQTSSDESDEADQTKKDTSDADTTEPNFTDGMSVDQAISAVPANTQRVNVDQDVLSKPLVDMSLYKPCKLTASEHFKLRVAVWEGRAVGIDLTTKPKNPKLKACIEQQLKQVEWKVKVKSLNTVQFAY